MYRANYRCFVEGQQEKMYLERFEKIFNNYPQKVIKFNVSIGQAKSMATSYLSTNYDLVCLFDYDFKDELFEENIRLCNKYDKIASELKKAERHRVYTAYSSVCFDLWLLLHKQNYTAPVFSPDAYVNLIRNAYNLPGDADIKKEKVIEKIVNQISVQDVKNAIERADNIRKRKLNSDKIFIEKCSDTYYYSNPDFSIDLFLKQVIENFENG